MPFSLRHMFTRYVVFVFQGAIRGSFLEPPSSQVRSFFHVLSQSVTTYSRIRDYRLQRVKCQVQSFPVQLETIVLEQFSLLPQRINLGDCFETCFESLELPYHFRGVTS